MKNIMGIIQFFLKRKGEMAKMHHMATQEIVEGIYVIETKNANFHLVKAEEGYIAIDAGGSDAGAVQIELAKLNINPDQVKHILLTHTDFDHVAALSLFEKATIYLPEEEVQHTDGTTGRLFGMGRNKFDYDYEVIKDQEELGLENRKITAILTPGHTQGSTCYLMDDKYLFVGDTLSLQEGRVELFNSLFNQDDALQEKSIQKLAKMKGLTHIFTPHYGFTNHPEKAFKAFK